MSDSAKQTNKLNSTVIIRDSRRISEIVIPSVEFVSRDVMDANPSIPEVTIRYHLNKMLNKGKIRIVGEQQLDAGRPRIIYQLSNNTEE